MTTTMGTYFAGNAPVSSGVMGVVTNSVEFMRILALPRRVLDLSSVPDVTPLFHKRGGTLRFWPIQSAALIEAAKADGLFAPIGVGWGKCVVGETEVYDTANGTRRRVDSLGSFSVSTMRADGCVTKAAATAVSSGKKQCVRVELADGSAVVLSYDHPVFTSRGWVPVGDLQLSDLVATPRQQPAPDQPLQISDDEVKLVAYLAADGGTTAGITFTNASEKILREFVDVVERLGVPDRRWQLTGVRFRGMSGKATEYSARGVFHLVKKYGLSGKKATEKRIPAEFYGLNDRQIGLFLNRFWACDGHIGKRRVLEVTLASEELIDDLRFLLLRLGVRSHKHYKTASYKKNGVKRTFDAWRIIISSAPDVLRFFSQVGLIWSKEKVSNVVIDASSAIQTNPNTDVVPISRNEIKEICDELGYPGRGSRRSDWPRTTLRERLSRSTAHQRVGRRKFEKWVKRVDTGGSSRGLHTTIFIGTRSNRLSWWVNVMFLTLVFLKQAHSSVTVLFFTTHLFVWHYPRRWTARKPCCSSSPISNASSNARPRGFTASTSTCHSIALRSSRIASCLAFSTPRFLKTSAPI